MFKTFITHISLTIAISGCCAQQSGRLFFNDAVDNTTGLASQFGHPAEEYRVITEDGYILGVFHLPGSRGLPVLLMHGIMDSSDTWLIRGNKSLGITLANLGFDVWLGNCRGNVYSREHVYINADRDASVYWDFSFHEHGYYDLPATIDFVLEKTGASKLNAIGHSQGNTIFYVMAASRPEYNDKVNSLIALAPIAFLQDLQPPISLLIEVSPQLYSLARNLHLYEIFGDSSTGKAYRSICSKPIVGYPLCAFGWIFPIVGYDLKEYDYNFHYKVTRNFPRSTSTKNLYHFAQLNRRQQFSPFDYGEAENMAVYGSRAPPPYELGRVRLRAALLAGRADRLAPPGAARALAGALPGAARALAGALPGAAQVAVLGYDDMNHLDFIWGKRMDQYLFPYIFKLLEKFLY